MNGKASKNQSIKMSYRAFDVLAPEHKSSITRIYSGNIQKAHYKLDSFTSSCACLTTIANENNYTLKHLLVTDIAFKERPVQLLT